VLFGEKRPRTSAGEILTRQGTVPLLPVAGPNAAVGTLLMLRGVLHQGGMGGQPGMLVAWSDVLEWRFPGAEPQESPGQGRINKG